MITDINAAKGVHVLIKLFRKECGVMQQRLIFFSKSLGIFAAQERRKLEDRVECKIHLVVLPLLHTQRREGCNLIRHFLEVQ